jgi:quercetin dioxygenase-like cupin family protein
MLACMTQPSFSEFEAAARTQGFDEVLERRWQPNLVLDEHRHPFAAQALVVAGEMWLQCRGQTQHLRPGDRFALERDEPHAERYGPEGATYWVARRNQEAS